MLYAKFDSPLLGKFWLEIETGSFEQGNWFAQGCQFGSQFSTTPMSLVDTRLSKHPTEKTLTQDEALQLLSTILPF